jgi:Txe/YoeB family toxin of Txe-Axe toxin-antitoxin module
MNLIFNELSFYPLSDNEHIAESRFRHLLDTYKEFKNEFGFKHIQFQADYQKKEIINGITFQEWISNLSNRNIKDLILGLCKSPYTDELEETELEEFFKSDYKIDEEDVPVETQPFALPVAFIKSLPTISFNSYPLWEKRKISLKKTNTEEIENLKFITYNICNKADISSKEFIEWTDKSMSNLITSIDILKKYLSYSKYDVNFSDNFINQLFEWKVENNKLYKYTLLLMKDVEIHPFTGGMGRTENLRYRGKEASKRITQSDRLSYSIENNIVTFIACKGHYNFH